LAYRLVGECVTSLRRSVDANRNFPRRVLLSRSRIGAPGRLDGARNAVTAGLEIDPTFGIRRLRAGVMSHNPSYVAQRERVYDAVSKAGVPED
jgi:hypothetical protein